MSLGKLLRHSFAIVSSLFLLTAGVAGAALPPTGPGAFDPTFGSGGKVVTNPTSRVEQTWGSALQPDGQLDTSFGGVPRDADGRGVEARLRSRTGFAEFTSRDGPRFTEAGVTPPRPLSFDFAQLHNMTGLGE